MKDSFNTIYGILFIVFGVIIFFAPNSVFEMLFLIGGALIIAFNVINIINLLKSKEELIGYSLVSSLLGAFFGILLITYRAEAVKLIPELIGIWFLITGISTLIILLRNKTSGEPIVRAVLKIVIGAICLFLPVLPIAGVGIMIGIVLILTGISILTTKKEEEVIYKVRVKK